MRSQAALKSWARVITARQSNEPTIFEMNFCVLAGLMNAIDA